MVNLKSMSSAIVLLSFFCAMLFFTSCVDDCKDTLCINGDCNESTGLCDCDEGWEGSDCSIPVCWENSTYNETTELCECDPGWTGDDCLDSTCGPNGTYNELTELCDCNPGWAGADCLEEACGPNGTFNTFTGECDCDPGYTGADCSELTVSNFTGSYFVNEICDGQDASYTSDIGAGGTDNAVLITNFWGIFENVVNATVSGNDLTIPVQEPDGDAFLVQGSGVMSADGTTLTISFLISDVSVSPADVQSCTAVYTKQ